MGRRKIEIKAIKDDRNRSVTFLKRKGGLFKKAHELSVLCSVDVAVIIFGANKKLYEYSSSDMREMITRYTYHGGPNEHKGPADFNTGTEAEDNNSTPPQSDGMDPQMLPSHFQTQPQFPHLRNHTPSASPPIPNGVFGAHPGAGPRGHTPQPPMGSRPPSRNELRRMGPNMVGQPVGPPGHPQQTAVNGFTFIPQQAVYNNAQSAPNMGPNVPPHGLPQQPHPPYAYAQPQAPPHAHHMQPFVDEQQRRSSGPHNFAPQPQVPPPAPRHSVSPPQPAAPQLPATGPSQPVPHMSPAPPHPPLVHPVQSPPQAQQHLPPPQPQEPPHMLPPHHVTQPPMPVEPMAKPEPVEKPRQPLLLDTNVKTQPSRKGGSIFTPIDENRSILSQHLAAFRSEIKPETQSKPEEPAKTEVPTSQPQSVDGGNGPRNGNASSPPAPQGVAAQAHPHINIKRNDSLSSIPETVFTPPSRSNSLRVGGNMARPRLKVQIPDESDGGSATAESGSPRGTTTTTDVTSQPSRRPADTHSGVVLPPPSPSASALLSAGATGPPNPFARPPPHQNSNNNNNNNNNSSSHNGQNNSIHIETPVSALPSRFLHEFLPSPSSFYPDWNFRGSDSNTLPSPLNFATPVVGTGPSFLRDEPTPQKRKSPDISGGNGGGGSSSSSNGGSHHNDGHSETGNEAKRIKVDS